MGGARFLQAMRDSALLPPDPTKPVLRLVRSAFDDRAGYAFTHQVFVDEKPAYYDFANKTHNMTGAEVFAEFGPAQG